MKTNLPHLVITNFEQKNFTPPLRAANKKARPKRIRDEHSIFLKEKLKQAWADADENQAVYHTHRNGVYLEFKGEQGYELVTKGLENLRGKDPALWTRLLNIREEIVQTKGEDQTEKIVYATLYIPNGKKDILLGQIEKYATEENKKSGQPKNATLLESISNISKALDVESFWQDTNELIPADDPEWCEVWLSSNQDEIIQRFDLLLSQLKINSKSDVIRFPERTVKIIQVNRRQLENITRQSDDIAEYRRAKETAAFWLDQNNKEQAEWVKTILERLKFVPDSEVSVCILDTGVNNGHPLIAPVLSSKDCQCVNPKWGNHDHCGHGTLMAGVSAYGDLKEVLTHNELIQLKHCLESVKILPPTGKTDPRLWGFITEQGIFLAEIQSPKKKRIICMAVASNDTRDQGRPSSWSGKLDRICSGTEDDTRRLFIVCAGNAVDWGNYYEAQLSDSIHDPAQSWNALTVGAYTELDQIIDPTLSDYSPIAPAGGLSPFSTTSNSWSDEWPIKPDILMEGGNLAKDASDFITKCDDLSLLSTSHTPHQAHFVPFYMTSAATAQAAWFAAQIQSEYPNYWPETIRGLMVHSAEWTDTLKRQFLDNGSKTAYKKLLRICGYGIPNIAKALYSASNSLTLIAQSELQPFDKKEIGSGYCTKDMHLYELPWPKEALQSLPSTTEVQMRITLSYFVEPGPGEIGWKDRYRYASYGLRFDLNAPTETKEGFEKKINKNARDESFNTSQNQSVTDHWTLGSNARDKGSIHSDIWTGTAADLAASNYIAIYPTIGWWRERSHLSKWNRRARYSLIVSINTPEQSVNIYTPVERKLRVAIPIEINI